MADAMKAVVPKLRDLASQKPTIMVTQGVGEVSGIDRLVRDYPHITIAGNSRDNGYPALSWENWAALVLIQRFM